MIITSDNNYEVGKIYTSKDFRNWDEIYDVTFMVLAISNKEDYIEFCNSQRPDVDKSRLELFLKERFYAISMD